VTADLIGTVELCDRCPAEATHTVVIAAGDLVFCNHHTTEITAIMAVKGTDYRVLTGTDGIVRSNTETR
jgi:hypothetical protein